MTILARINRLAIAFGHFPQKKHASKKTQDHNSTNVVGPVGGVKVTHGTQSSKKG
jgi:hypothetical protein